MLSASLIALGVAVTLGVVAIASRLRAHLNDSTRFPPSPPSDPIIGHARRIPQQYPWETFSAWKKAFGELKWSCLPTSHLSSLTVLYRRHCLRPCFRTPYVHIKLCGMCTKPLREEKCQLLGSATYACHRRPVRIHLIYHPANVFRANCGQVWAGLLRYPSFRTVTAGGGSVDSCNDTSMPRLCRCSGPSSKHEYARSCESFSTTRIILRTQ